MTDTLKALKEKQMKRRELLAQQLGVTNPANLRSVLSSKEEQQEREANKKQNTASGSGTVVKKRPAEDLLIDTSTGYDPIKEMLEKEKELKKARVDGEVEGAEEEEEELVYTDSSAFLKGTQSANPHNDYCQHFVDTGERPQNFIRDVGLANRFEEYPKLRELIRLKDELIQNTNTPPMYLKIDPATYDLRDLDTKFDAIMIDAPLEEYQRTSGIMREKYMSWEEIENLEIESIAAPRSFIWIWCGSSDGLDAGRRCLKKWGYRRCEDICWIKTNIKNPGHQKNLEPRAVFQRTKEHCLMGIKGTVRRSVDGDFIHANVDIDLIIEEEKPFGSAEKPVEIFHMIEHFCLGRRRLHLFGNDSSIRPGWVTVGQDLTSSNYEAETFNGYFTAQNGTGTTTGCSEEIERLRPKSPPAKAKGEGGRGRGGRGRGGFRGRGRGRGGRG